MKKSLLFGVALCSTILCAQADKIDGITLSTPHWMPNAAIQKISPDGHYAVSSVYGDMVIYDLQSGEAWTYEGDDTTFDYTAGTGNCFSAEGIMVGCTKSMPDARYWKEGAWYYLPIPNVSGGCLADGITSDGSRICGSLPPSRENDMEGLMKVPVYWDRNDSGDYGDPVYLPHPDKDVTGRVPQYITAICISDDGNTIYGQIRDYSGFLTEPIVYTCNDNGEWTYNLIGRSLLNPDNITFPDFPGDSPAVPQAENYMSDEQRAAYEEAYQAWLDEGDWDPATEPNPANYLSEAQISEYNKAVDEYNAWLSEYLKFSNTLEELMLNATSFLFNNCYLTADGKYAAATGIKSLPDPDNAGEMNKVNFGVLFNLKDNTHVLFEESPNVRLSDLAADGTLYGTYQEGIEPEEAYILPFGKDKFEPLVDYVASKNEGLGNWMMETMTHDVEMAGGINKKLITGTPFCSADQNVIGGYCLNYWGGDNGAQCYAYLFSWDSDPNTVKVIEAGEEIDVTAVGNGVIDLKGCVDVDVYTFDGTNVFSGKHMSGKISTGLRSGIYLINIANGKEHLTKKINI